MDQKLTLTIGELFAGAGGLSLGFILANHPNIRFQPVFAIDNDSAAISSFKYNMNWLHENVPDILPQTPAAFEANVEDVDVPALLRSIHPKEEGLDLLLGGPPCQGFSTSNRRSKEKSKADRNRLINVFLDKLQEFKPKMFLIENVQGVQWTQPTEDMSLPPLQEGLFPDIPGEKGLTSVQKFLVQKARMLDYYVWCGVLDAVIFGVPQHRMRFFLFGVRKDLILDKNLINLAPYLKELEVDEKISVRKAIGDLPPLNNGECWGEGEYYPDDNNYIREIRRYMSNGDLEDHITTLHADYVIERYKKIPEGGNWKNIQEDMTNYKQISNTHSNIYRRLIYDKPAITISHYRKSMLIHPSQDRGLSFREACRLQSFPDWCKFMGKTNDKQQQLANAVPPLMAAAVAKAIGNFWLNLLMSGSTLSLPENKVEA